MKKKYLWMGITVVVLLGIVVICVSVGSNSMKHTQTDSGQETLTNETDSFQIDGITLSVFDVNVNDELKTVRLSVKYSKDAKCPDNPQQLAETYWPSLRVREQSHTSDAFSYTVNMAGFYEDINELSDLKIVNSKTLESYDYTPIVDIKQDVPVKKYDFVHNKANIQVSVTPFSVVITPDRDTWREENEFFNLVAVMQDDTKRLVTYIPMQDTRKPSVKEKEPVSFDAEEKMPWFGGGSAGTFETKNGGMEFATFQEIDLEEVKSMQLEKFH